jgi:rhodanese-related sulfurtransferase
LSKDKLNILYCYSEVCHLAAKAATKFAQAGYPVMEMDGGWEAWKEHDLPIESGEASSKSAKTRGAA